MQAVVTCKPVAEVKSKAFSADYSKVVDKYKDYRQYKVGIFVNAFQFFWQFYDSPLFVDFNKIYDFILQ